MQNGVCIKLVSLLFCGAFGLLLLAGCGVGLCANQAACPDGSWSNATPDALTFVELFASTMLRDKTAAQISLRAELNLGTTALPSGYRYAPDMTKDDDGMMGGSVTLGTRASSVCGTTQTTIEARIADCAATNSAMATWDGATKGVSGEGQWKLVTYNGTHEVWRDERTKLIWSDSLGTGNWCRASGSSGGGPFAQVDPSSICTNVANQSQVTPESWCTEYPGLNTPSTYDSAKGGMRLAATSASPSVVWRLPTRADFNQAEIDGIRHPLPHFDEDFWSASIYSASRNIAWYFSGYYGGMVQAAFRDNNSLSIRCVGR